MNKNHPATSYPAQQDSAPQAFFEAMCAAYDQAARQTDVVKRRYSIAGYPICLQFAGPGLIPALTPAIEHLAVLPDSAAGDAFLHDSPPCSHAHDAANTAPATPILPELTICLWDTVSTGARIPMRPKEWNQVFARGDVQGYNDDRFLTALPADVGALNLLDRKRNLGIYWVHNPYRLPVYEQAAPLKAIYHWWLREVQLPMIHAAAVGTGDGGVLLVGKSGTGKSTTALACLEAGMRYVADDRCLVAIEPEPHAICLYNSAKLWPEQMRHFPRIQSAMRNVYSDKVAVAPQPAVADAEKALIFVHRYAPAQLAHSLPLRAILRTVISGRPETTIVPVAPIRALLDLAPSSLIYQPGAAHEEVRGMAELVRRLPCYQINLGTELTRIPEVIAEFLANQRSVRA